MAKTRQKPRQLEPEAPKKRSRTSQSDVPSYSLAQSLRIPQVIADQFAMKPVRPLNVAQGLSIQPTSGSFRMLCGASIAYGLTDGGYNADQISITPLGRRIIAPTKEGDDAFAMREAMLKPRVLREFLRQYDGAKVPRQDIAKNVLHEMGVPRDATDRTLKLIIESAATVGFLRDVNGASYIDLNGTPIPETDISPDESGEVGTEEVLVDETSEGEPLTRQFPLSLPNTANQQSKETRVFIAHGKNMSVVEQIKTMLNVAEVQYEIAVEEQSTAIPVPEKVLGAMRNCTAAIICVTSEGDSAGTTINQNVLIEIGAAFVLYDKRVILLWDKKVPVPSNLQGLSRCEFEGTELSWSAGMQLMAVIKKFRDN